MSIQANSRWTRKWFPLSGAAVGIALYLPLMMFCEDWSTFLYVAICVPMLTVGGGVVLLAWTIWKRRFPNFWMISTLPAYWVVTLLLVVNTNELQLHARWLFHSASYKAQLMSLPQRNKDELRHLEWEDWGWIGSHTTGYLVFDPSDTLSAAARHENSQKQIGLPCEVAGVQRLERQWYEVVFYTDTDWDSCVQSAQSLPTPNR